MFLASMLLILAGSVIMDAYYSVTGLEFITGLFIVMGGCFLFAISLNYGRPPVYRPLPPLEGEATGAH